MRELRAMCKILMIFFIKYIYNTMMVPIFVSLKSVIGRYSKAKEDLHQPSNPASDVKVTVYEPLFSSTSFPALIEASYIIYCGFFFMVCSKSSQEQQNQQ